MTNVQNVKQVYLAVPGVLYDQGVRITDINVDEFNNAFVLKADHGGELVLDIVRCVESLQATVAMGAVILAYAPMPQNVLYQNNGMSNGCGTSFTQNMGQGSRDIECLVGALFQHPLTAKLIAPLRKAVFYPGQQFRPHNVGQPTYNSGELLFLTLDKRFLPIANVATKGDSFIFIFADGSDLRVEMSRLAPVRGQLHTLFESIPHATEADLTVGVWLDKFFPAAAEQYRDIMNADQPTHVDTRLFFRVDDKLRLPVTDMVAEGSQFKITVKNQAPITVDMQRVSVLVTGGDSADTLVEDDDWATEFKEQVYQMVVRHYPMAAVQYRDELAAKSEELPAPRFLTMNLDMVPIENITVKDEYLHLTYAEDNTYAVQMKDLRLREMPERWTEEQLLTGSITDVPVSSTVVSMVANWLRTHGYHDVASQYLVHMDQHFNNA